MAHSWRQEALTENYREVARLGKEFYERLATFADRFDEISGWTGRSRRITKRPAPSNRASLSALAACASSRRAGAELPPADPIERVPRVLKQVGLMGLPEGALAESEVDDVERSIKFMFSPMSDPCRPRVRTAARLHS